MGQVEPQGVDHDSCPSFRINAAELQVPAFSIRGIDFVLKEPGTVESVAFLLFFVLFLFCSPSCSL